jgi:hypothetical protein
MGRLFLRSSQIVAPPSEFASYSTNFDGTENPLSEGGVWLNAGGAVAQYWQPMRKAGGRIFGTNFATEYQDCVAIIDPNVIPFGGNHVVRGKFHITGGYSAPDFTHESQLLLRGAFGNNFIRGYEILFQLGASKPTIAKWYGAGGGGFFAQLANTSESDLGFQHGDIAIAQISGTSPALIEVFRDRGGTILPWATASDNGSVLGGAPVEASGQPGVAAFTRDDVDMQLDGFGWDSYEASDDPGDFE